MPIAETADPRQLPGAIPQAGALAMCGAHRRLDRPIHIFPAPARSAAALPFISLFMPRVFTLRPPYTQPTLLADRDRSTRGAVLLVQIEEADATGGRLKQALERLRRVYPGSPLAFWLPDAVLEPHLRAVARAARWGVRAICAGSRPGVESLRPQLTDTAFLADEMVTYMTGCGIAMTLRSEWLLRALISGSAQQCSMGEVLDLCGCSRRTSRRLFQKSAVPAPRAWFQMARALHAALALQREPGTSVAECAFLHAYTDASTLSRSLLRAFSRRPTEVRRMLGWEPLFWDWLGSHRVGELAPSPPVPGTPPAPAVG